MSADEYPFTQGAAGAFNSSFYGETVGMVVRAEQVRTHLPLASCEGGRPGENARSGSAPPR